MPSKHGYLITQEADGTFSVTGDDVLPSYGYLSQEAAEARCDALKWYMDRSALMKTASPAYLVLLDVLKPGDPFPLPPAPQNFDL